MTILSIVIVIINSVFLQRPQKRSHENQLIHRRLSKTKSIGSRSDPESQASRLVTAMTMVGCATKSDKKVSQFVIEPAYFVYVICDTTHQNESNVGKLHS